jgi:hypothetical protein
LAFDDFQIQAIAVAQVLDPFNDSAIVDVIGSDLSQFAEAVRQRR